MSIPRDPSWCSRCVAPERDGRAASEPCDDHRGPDGRPVIYDGPDEYDPSSWVLEVVGKRYSGPGPVIYECFGYDMAAALETLRRNGLVDQDGQINDAGRAALRAPGAAQ